MSVFQDQLSANTLKRKKYLLRFGESLVINISVPWMSKLPLKLFQVTLTLPKGRVRSNVLVLPNTLTNCKSEALSTLHAMYGL